MEPHLRRPATEMIYIAPSRVVVLTLWKQTSYDRDAVHTRAPRKWRSDCVASVECVIAHSRFQTCRITTECAVPQRRTLRGVCIFYLEQDSV